MLYINEEEIKKIHFSWEDTIDVIKIAINCMLNDDYSQPLKPYLRFKKQINRIIAMPAYVGGKIDSAGIKWIASFPENIKHKIPRASSVTVLNDTLTGIPVAIFNTAFISIIRTASVSGYVIKKYLEFIKKKRYNVGIIGWGPIGQNHYSMCKQILKNRINSVYIYDKSEITINDEKITVCNSWQDVYDKADIFITCTSTLERYINLPTNSSKLILDISLRDFKAEALDSFSKPFIIDDWNEVNREDTDIEYYSKMEKLIEKECISLCDVYNYGLRKYYTEGSTVFFAPMGMGAFDIAIGNYFYQEAIKNRLGVNLD